MDKPTKQELQDLQPTIEQWQQLYKLADDIYVKQPWDKLSTIDYIVVTAIDESGNNVPPILVSIGGAGSSNNESITIYPGWESIQSYFASLELYDYVLPGGSVSGLSVIYKKLDKVPSRISNVTKELGLDFKYKPCPLFSSEKMGCLPWQIYKDEAQILIMVLQQVLIAIEDFFSGTCVPDFDNDEVLVRLYDSRSKSYITKKEPIFEVPLAYVSISDESLSIVKNKKKDLSTLNDDIEVASFYIPQPVGAKGFDRPVYPVMFIAFNKSKGEMIAQWTPEKMTDLRMGMPEFFCSLVFNKGIPKKVFVQNDSTKVLLQELCDVFECEIVRANELKAFEGFYRNMLQFMLDATETAFDQLANNNKNKAD